MRTGQLCRDPDVWLSCTFRVSGRMLPSRGDLLEKRSVKSGSTGDLPGLIWPNHKPGLSSSADAEGPPTVLGTTRPAALTWARETESPPSLRQKQTPRTKNPISKEWRGELMTGHIWQSAAFGGAAAVIVCQEPAGPMAPRLCEASLPPESTRQRA